MNTNHIKPGQPLEAAKIVRVDTPKSSRNQGEKVIGNQAGRAAVAGPHVRAPAQGIRALVEAINELAEVRADVVANAKQKLSDGSYASRQTAIDAAKAILSE